MQKHTYLKPSSGFSMVELLMVIVTLGIIGTVALPGFMDLSQEAKVAASRDYLNNIKTAIDIKRQQMILRCNLGPGRWPTATSIIANDVTESGSESALCSMSQLGGDTRESRFLDQSEVEIPINPFNGRNDIVSANFSDLCSLDPAAAGYYYDETTGEIGHPQISTSCTNIFVASGGGSSSSSSIDGGSSSSSSSVDCDYGYSVGGDTLCYNACGEVVSDLICIASSSSSSTYVEAYCSWTPDGMGSCVAYAAGDGTSYSVILGQDGANYCCNCGNGNTGELTMPAACAFASSSSSSSSVGGGNYSIQCSWEPVQGYQIVGTCDGTVSTINVGGYNSGCYSGTFTVRPGSFSPPGTHDVTVAFNDGSPSENTSVTCNETTCGEGNHWNGVTCASGEVSSSSEGGGSLTASCSWSGVAYIISGSCYAQEQGGATQVSALSGIGDCVGSTYGINIGASEASGNVQQYVGADYVQASFNCSGGGSSSDESSSSALVCMPSGVLRYASSGCACEEEYHTDMGAGCVSGGSWTGVDLGRCESAGLIAPPECNSSSSSDSSSSATGCTPYGSGYYMDSDINTCYADAACTVVNYRAGDHAGYSGGCGSCTAQTYSQWCIGVDQNSNTPVDDSNCGCSSSSEESSSSGCSYSGGYVEYGWEGGIEGGSCSAWSGMSDGCGNHTLDSTYYVDNSYCN